MVLTTSPRSSKIKLANHERLVSFEPSHSWIKRFDDTGATIIQAGWKVNPTGRFYKDEQNPHVLYNDTSKLYGERACEGAHVSPLNQRKEDIARDAFAATLKPSDDTKELTVVVSHWHEETGHTIAARLYGDYDVTINGVRIQTTVKRAFAELEGKGAYYLVKPQLKPGKTLLFELGHGTSEEWIIDAGTDFFNGQATENMAVSKLVDTIAGDQMIRAHCLKLGEQDVNRELIAKALRTGQFGSMPSEHWEAVTRPYINEWFNSIKNYLLKQYGSELQSISNIVMSGGGAALIRDRANGFALIPESPETASVRGCYFHHAAIVGA